MRGDDFVSKEPEPIHPGAGCDGGNGAVEGGFSRSRTKRGPVHARVSGIDGEAAMVRIRRGCGPGTAQGAAGPGGDAGVAVAGGQLPDGGFGGDGSGGAG